MSEWGHDFRPDYLRLRPVIEELGRPPVMACTATATPKVADEIVARLGLREPERVRSGFDRPNLSFDVLPFDGEGSVARKRGQLVAGLQMPENRPAVVYCGTRKSTEEIAALLIEGGLAAVAYHAGMGAAGARREPESRSCPARRTSWSRRTRSAWASTRPTCARSGTGRCRRASRPTTRRPGARAATACPRAPSCSPRARTSGGSCASSARPR